MTTTGRASASCPHCGGVLVIGLQLMAAPTEDERAPDEPAELLCPEHRRAARSKKHDGLYCPERRADGAFCQWTSGGGSGSS